MTVLPHGRPRCSACGRPKARDHSRQLIAFQRDIPLNRPGMAASSVLVAQLNDTRVYITPSLNAHGVPTGALDIVVSDKRLAP